MAKGGSIAPSRRSCSPWPVLPAPPRLAARRLLLALGLPAPGPPGRPPSGDAAQVVRAGRGRKGRTAVAPCRLANGVARRAWHRSMAPCRPSRGAKRWPAAVGPDLGGSAISSSCCSAAGRWRRRRQRQVSGAAPPARLHRLFDGRSSALPQASRRAQGRLESLHTGAARLCSATPPSITIMVSGPRQRTHMSKQAAAQRKAALPRGCHRARAVWSAEQNRRACTKVVSAGCVCQMPFLPWRRCQHGCGGNAASGSQGRQDELRETTCPVHLHLCQDRIAQLQQNRFHHRDEQA